MSTASTGIGGNTNAACCSIPAVHTDAYTPKGSYKEYGGFERVYVTGPSNNQSAIVCVYDIFGYFPQTQQGADIIASTLNTIVYMPDFFEPAGAFPSDKHPPKTPENKELFAKFWKETADIPANVSKLTKFGEALKSSGVEKIGVYGFCWGGKIAMSVGSESSIFSAISLVHPALLSADDAVKLAVPLALYPSKDEPLEEYHKMVEIIGKKPFAAQNDHKLYQNMHHGWAAARANLKDANNKAEFEDVYTHLADFFKKTLV